MNKETQNLLWAILSKEERKDLRTIYALPAENEFHKSCDNARRNYFGHHNLTSDKEPEELLTVERKRITEAYENATADLSRTGNLEYKGKKDLLETLFGNKCLPDPTEEKPTPKFKVGDKVKIIDSIDHKGKVSVISEIIPHAFDKKAVVYGLKDIMGTFMENTLAPYTEPQPQQTEERNEEDMQEKKLNLCELLAHQDHDGTYSPIYGEVDVTDIACDRLVITSKNSSDSSIELFPDGRFSQNGDCQLFPSRDLYLKYPLEAAKAWKIWTEERKSKRWRAKQGDVFYRIEIDGQIFPRTESFTFGDNKLFEQYNYFRTESEAKEAAEAVKHTLEEFHEKNAEK